MRRIALAPAPRDLRGFEGAWHIARRIEDRRAGQTALAEGVATLTRDGDGLTYDERLTLRLPGQAPMAAERRYLWRATQAGIAVLFADGRPFHDLRLDTAAPEGAHWCDPDRYAVAYDFHSWPDWTATWVVAGPRKDCTMVTDYTPRSAR